jgi:hypothetical protein
MICSGRVSAQCLLQDFQDFNKDGLGPDIVWRNKYTRQNRIWFMNGRTYTASSTGPIDETDIDYRIAGTGQFDNDTDTTSPTKDLLWQNERTSNKAVWFMNGVNFGSAANITPVTLPEWRIVGSGDFDGDCNWDIVYQNTLTGSKAIWLMNGTTFVKTVYPSPDNNDTNWVVEAVADMGKVVGGVPTGVRDGIPDLVFRHYGTGQQAIWFMSRPSGPTSIYYPVSGGVIKDSVGNPLVQTDKDWSIVGAGDYNGDSKTDLVLRRADIGLTVVWYMDGNKYLGNNPIDPSNSGARRGMYGNAWKVATQKTADTINRIDQMATNSKLVMWATDSSDSQLNKITLTWAHPPLIGSQKFELKRKKITDPDSAYVTVVQNLVAFSYTDSGVQAGQLYNYRVQALAFGNNGTPITTTAGVKGAPILNRGRVILLVDSSVSAQLASDLATFKDDLVGDGWRVLRHDVPRHVDSATSGDAYRINNGTSVTNIKALIQSDYIQDTANTKAVLIVGHVAVPYSGDVPDDSHAVHYGTWAADIYYGDVGGAWSDNIQRTAGPNGEPLWYSESFNYNGDQKWDNETAPNVKLAVGRIDFARLPAFGSVSETTLIKRYLAKNHRFRRKQSPYPLPALAIAYGGFQGGTDPTYQENDNIYRNAYGNSKWLLGNQPNSLVVGSSYRQLTRGFLWGFLAGAGGTASIDVYNSAPVLLQESTAGLVDPFNQPKIGFHLILGSFMADWNEDNNFMRSTLATTDYNLAIMWVRNAPNWNFAPMSQGGTLGDGLLATSNRRKYISILGDSTLRLQAIAPVPSDPVWNPSTKVLSWGFSSDDKLSNPSDVYYVVERAPNKDSTWTLLTTTTSTSFNDSTGSGTRTYRVRARKLSFTGGGSYYNLSEARFRDVTN